uniref:DUF2877 domain-containing protein n=1 Tax=Citrobacter freundii TaxID=546 RepID=A0A7T8TIX5_CITFR|nr:DUF2877 domain-containing protein [Citrobacter freundii]
MPRDIISRHRRALTRIIISRLDRTNDISQHYLKRATEGHFSEAICQLLTHLSAPFSPSPLAAARDSCHAVWRLFRSRLSGWTTSWHTCVNPHSLRHNTMCLPEGFSLLRLIVADFLWQWRMNR